MNTTPEVKNPQLKIAVCRWNFQTNAPEMCSFLDQPPDFEPANAVFKILHVDEQLTADLQRELRERLMARMHDGAR